MMRLLFPLILFVTAAFGQYTLEPAATVPSDVPAPFAQLLSKSGEKIMSGGSVYCEIWLVSTKPNGPKSTEPSLTLPTIPHGSLLGVIHFPAQALDRRGQTIKPGYYTLRYSYYPQNGNHQGVALQRDFMVLSRLADDTDAAAKPTFDALMQMSHKASGTPHPLILSCWAADSGFKPGFVQQGEDWVLETKLGDTPIAITLVGQFEG